MNATATTERRRGFTLVELLVVITVIGIIAGLAVPAVMRALKTAKIAGMQAELETLNQGIEAYKTKYGDYPPDFSNWPVVQRHYLKIFQDIDPAELTLLYALCDDAIDNSAAQTDGTADGFPGSVMDRAEALVWSLGGFSSDPQHPFTGTGGPLVGMIAKPGTDPANYQYNPERDNRFVEFDSARLSITPYDPAVGALSFANRTRSNDEPPASYGLTGATFAADIFPAYALNNDASPIVYFDSRTYRYVPDCTTTGFNGYARFVDSATDIDGVRPLYSTTPNAKTVPTDTDGSYIDRCEASRAWTFMNPQTFQLLAPGLDRRFGPVTDADGTAGGPSNDEPVYFQYPTGALITTDDSATGANGLFVGSIKRYDLTVSPFNLRENHMTDNMSNFSSKTFGNELP